MGNYNFGNYICKFREKKGLSQSQLGEKLGVTNKAVSKWENGGAYPSTELMLPLAQALGVTIEDLYKAVSESGEPKPKLQQFYEFLIPYTKWITIASLALSVIPYILFLIFSTREDKLQLMIITPIICVIAYGMFRFSFWISTKNPFAPAKWNDWLMTIFIGIILIMAYPSIVWDFIAHFPDGYTFSVCMIPMFVMALIHTQKRRYG